MRRVLWLMLMIAFLGGGCAAPGGEGIEVREAWMRPAAQGANGAVYFVIANHSGAADEIVSIAAEVADAAEMHESMMNGDVMQMHPLGSVPLEEGAEVTFEPGGLHIMLVGLKQELKTGDNVELTLHFKNYEDVKVTVPVRDSPAFKNEHSENNL